MTGRATRSDDGQNDWLWDCIIIGAGPAGLTAALYMARYRRQVLVVHNATARALRIPLTHNAPGFPDGISGVDLIDRMTRHAQKYGTSIEIAEIHTAKHNGGIFRLLDRNRRSWRSRTLILATGLHLNQIPIPEDIHEAAIRAGVLRYCPICDAYEHIDKRIAVIGCDTQGASEALFLRRYTDNLTLIPKSFSELTSAQQDTLRRADITVVETPADQYGFVDNAMRLTLKSGEALDFDVVYPALGVQPRTALAECLGLATDESGCLDALTPFETQIPGLYSAGDIVDGLDQINVAIAHGAIAATKAHNWLREQDDECLLNKRE